MDVVWGEYIPGKISYTLDNENTINSVNETDQYRPTVPQIPAHGKGESGINEAFGQLDVATWHGEVCNHLTNCNLSRCKFSLRLVSHKLTITE